MEALALGSALGAIIYGLKLRYAAAVEAADAEARRQADAKAHHKFDPNLPIDAGGRVYHLQIKADEVSPRILSVGDAGRAERIAALFDPGTERITVTSSRGFITHTGYFNGVRVSVIATGMGVAMMDFVVRETRAIIEGPMVVVRYGTCGGLRDTPAGAIAVASQGAVLIKRDSDMAAVGYAGGGAPASASTGSGKPSSSSDTAAAAAGSPLVPPTPALPYIVTQVVKPHAALSAMVSR